LKTTDEEKGSEEENSSANPDDETDGVEGVATPATMSKQDEPASPTGTEGGATSSFEVEKHSELKQALHL
jgi:hypothetical protein